MEKFYVVTPKSKLWNDYFEYKGNAFEVNEHVKKFMDAQGITAKFYLPSNGQLWIEPTVEDLEKFDKVLGQPAGGIRSFKKNSKINKAWIKSLQENNLKVLSRPYLGFYFNGIMGRHSSRLFSVKDTVYCSLDAEHDFETPEGMIEMKASEFFKIIEDSK